METTTTTTTTTPVPRPMHRDINWGAVISLLVIIGCSAATLIHQTKDDAWFDQNVTVGISNENFWLTLGSYKTRFGWQQACYRINDVSVWTCDKYSHLGNDANALQILGKMTYLGGMVSVGLASTIFLSLLASMRKPLKRQPRGVISFVSILMSMYYISVVMVSFPVMASNFLDELDVAQHVRLQWAYGLSVVVTALWVVVGCMHF